MNFPLTTYLLNVALHAAVLSVFASLLLLGLRQARHRSVSAAAGLLTIGCLPWLTALHPAHLTTNPVPEIQRSEPAMLPTWTVVTLPAREKPNPAPTPAEPAAAESVFPDAVRSLVVVWAVGALTGMFLLGIAALRVRCWRRSLSHPDDHEWRILQALSPGIPACGRFLLSDATTSPCVIGFFRPQIVLPRFLLEAGSETGLRWAIRHEIGHWQAGDSRRIIFFSLIRCTNWWNPLLHKLVSQWADAREELCDLHATGISEERVDYGQFLVAMARKITKQPPLTVAMASLSPARLIRSRIISLLDAKAGAEKPAGMRFIGLGCCVTLCFVALVSCVRIGTDTGGGIVGAGVGAIITGAQTSLPAGPYVLPQQANYEEPLRVIITSKFMVTSPDTNFGGGSCTDKGVETIMKKFEKIGKSTLATTPSAIVRSGESTSVEIIDEVSEPGTGINPGLAKSPVPYVGIKLSSLPRVSNRYVVELHQIVDYRYVPGVWHFDGKNNKLTAGLTTGKIKTIKRTIDCKMLSGNTYVSLFGEIEPGAYLTLLTKAEIIDGMGRSIKLPE